MIVLIHFIPILESTTINENLRLRREHDLKKEWEYVKRNHS